jgi:DNA-binding GntR family transcriptional regulator
MGTAPRAASERPLREQVADDLRQQIDDGSLEAGDRLPPEEELAEKYHVSRHTVREALGILTGEGLLTSGRGRGRVVRAYRPLLWNMSGYESRSHHESAGDPGDQWDLAVREAGMVPSQEVEVVAIVEPPDRVAELLGVTDDELVVERRRIRLANGVPYQLASSYFRKSLVDGTPLMEPRDVSAPGGVLASIGHPQEWLVDFVGTRMPTRAESDRLDLPRGTPVLVIIRTGVDSTGTPLRVMVTVAAGDRHELYYRTSAS